jgi:hypothetical protein
MSTCSIVSPVDLQRQQLASHYHQHQQQQPAIYPHHRKLTCVELINASPTVLFWLALGVRFVKQSLDLASVICRLRFDDCDEMTAKTISIPQDVLEEESRLTRIHAAFQSINSSTFS